MYVELLIAPPASGKTQACIQRIQVVREKIPMAKIRVLVPDRQNAAYFRRRLAESGGGVGIAVGTFHDLYVDLLEQNGIFMPVITPALEHRLVLETVDAAFAAGELAHYEPIRSKPGFILALQDCFSELRSSLVRPERFLEYTQATAPARRELAVLYERFLARLQRLNWTDRDGQSWLAASVLESNPRAAADIQLVVVDGFTAFAGARRQVLKLLAKQVGEMLITLPGKPESTRQVHRGSLIAAKALLGDLSPLVTGLSAPPRLPADSLYLEQHILDPGKFPEKEADSPFLFEVRTQSEEAREALRWIKERVIRQHVPLSACAVFAGNLQTYQPLLRSAAEEFGLKVHFSQTDPLVESAAVMALLTLLRLPGEDYKTRMLLNTLRSPYFDFGLDAKALEDLEKVSQQAMIVSSREQWEAAWRMLGGKSRVKSEDDDEDRKIKDLTDGIDLPTLQKAFERFWSLFDTIARARTQAGWIKWLEDLLQSLHFYENITSQRDIEACSSLGQALKALVLSESVAGERWSDFARFLANLQGVFAGASVDESREARKDALWIGGMNEARASRFTAVALLGLSEGIFPAVENPDPFLDEELRRDLGLDPRLQREQAGVFYQAFTRADAHLLITRPYLSDDGELLEPSPYWLSARSLFTEKTVQRIQPDKTRPQADAASPQELLFWGVRQNQLVYAQDENLAVRWKELAGARGILVARRSKRAQGPYEGYIDQVADELVGKFSPQYTWSASRLEEYATCPQKFFVNSILKLAPKIVPETGLNAAQMGNLYHRILELIYRRALETGGSKAVVDLIDEAADNVFHTAPAVYGFRPSPLWQVEQGHFKEVLRQTILALEAISLEWTPKFFEQKFGFKDTPPVEIDLGLEVIRLHGMIDRVDQNVNGEIRVVDYKTGSSHMDKADLSSGRRLQLPIYALAAREALHLGEVAEGFYWKINEAAPSSIKLSIFEYEDEVGPNAAYMLVKDHMIRILDGVRSGEFPPRPPKGDCPEYCPAVQWCWRYQKGFTNA